MVYERYCSLIHYIYPNCAPSIRNNMEPLFDHQSTEMHVEDELSDVCDSHNLTEERIREILYRYRVTPNDNDRHVSDYTFFRRACKNINTTCGILQCLLEHFPNVSDLPYDDDNSPLHYACKNPNATLEIVKLLVEAFPTSVCTETEQGLIPLHLLCTNKRMDDEIALQILNLLLRTAPNSVWHADRHGCLPIHYASLDQTATFCSVILANAPGSVRVVNTHGALPLHYACVRNRPTTVEYLLTQYPDAIHHAVTVTETETCPIHVAIWALGNRRANQSAFDVVRLLLDYDPNIVLQKKGGKTLLHIACGVRHSASTIATGMAIITHIYDRHPYTIHDDAIAENMHKYHPQVQHFLSSELVYARQSKDRRIMTTPDDNGQLPLHTALRQNCTLGSIKLLVDGNPHAVPRPDSNGSIPLHIASRHHHSTDIVKYLVDLDITNIGAVDNQGDTALHCACRGAKYDTIALLLQTRRVAPVSQQNNQKQLAIEVLWDSEEVNDRESREFTECVYRLLRAYPDTLPDMSFK